MSRRYLRAEIGTAGVFALLVCAREASAQQAIGSVATDDAIVAGNTITDNQRSTLLENVTITAKDRPAYVELQRGGSIKVCSTSGVHLTAGNPVIPKASKPATGQEADVKSFEGDAAVPPMLYPLMVSLDRGAAELHTSVLASDVMMTPDLKVSFSAAGPLDLRIRVASNGDTCIENRLAGLDQHPALEIASLFGSDNYRVLPGQHVMFEHGNLREVVDNESSPCGCPNQPVKTIEASPEISLLPGTKVPMPTLPAAARFPFPDAVSQGLAPSPPVPQAEPGQIHTQVATTLAFKGDQPEASRDSGQSPVPSATKIDPKPQKSGFFHGVGHFFKKVFGS